ncbi:hypothetical protein [Streptomyces sp. NPDC006645]|uniref:hypothetical protein n=1 Tax=unclassified Streptomyces TaxID=2593676 RepID=UPI0033B29A21
MPDHSDAARAAEDEGCLRRVMAVPLVILHALATACCYSALTIRPSGTWDDDAYGAITLSCFLTIALSAVALLITVVPPSVRRAMGRRWLVPPLALAAIASVQWAAGG